MRRALTVEYDGSKYHGFQYQKNASSVQEELEKSIADLTGEWVRVHGAGRTDAGVHAKGQVVAFNTRSNIALDALRQALNHYLPDDIAVIGAYAVDDTFDPRRDAVARWYRYTVLNRDVPSPLLRRYSYLVRECLNVNNIRLAAKSMVGVHDFGRFSSPLGDKNASTVRHVHRLEVDAAQDILTFDIEGNAFLPRQVRRMVGCLLDVGRGRIAATDIQEMLDGKSTGVIAHAIGPQGLCLMRVEYVGFPPAVGDSNGDKFQAT